MQILLVLFFLPLLTACGAQIKSSKSGPWSAAATWAKGTIPGENDTVSISDKHVVTVSDERIIGASEPAGSVAIQLNKSGRIVIAAGGVLTVRGDTVYSSDGTNHSDALVVEGGGTWRFDGSRAPKGTRYKFYPQGEGGFRAVRLKGTAAARAKLMSDPGGANGAFALSGSSGGLYVFAFGEVTRIGDAATPAFEVGYERSGEHLAGWDVTDTIFDSCGLIRSVNAAGVEDDGAFRHNRNVHQHTAAPEIFTNWIQISETNQGGRREVMNNVFDVSMTRSQLFLPAFTITGNYFGDAFGTPGPGWKTFDGNFLRYTDWWGSTNSATALLGDVSNSYVFVDSNWGNPKPLISSPHYVGNLNGIIFGQAGTALGPPGVQDSGELFFNTSPSAPKKYGIYNSIILPNMNGYASLALGAWGGFPNMLGVAEHNVWFGGFRGQNSQFGFPAIQIGEGYKAIPGQIASFRSNIIWNPHLEGYTNYSRFAKIADIGGGWSNSAPATDACRPADCDYNTGWRYFASNPQASQYTNQGKGYVARFSAPPGQHDVDADPAFVDFKRSVELFDSKYLGNEPPAWSASATYKAGDFVRLSRPDVYWNLPVNYRYTGSSTCKAANPEPARANNWRECWEWASLYRIREAIAASKTFTDPKIGARDAGVIQTLILWIRAGYSPTNPKLVKAGHDGRDIGAVPVTAAH